MDPEVAPRILLREPVPMTEGKTAIAEFEIIKRDSITLREAGHLGPAVEHYAWGHAKYGALVRFAKAWHGSVDHAGRDGVSGRMLALTEFVVCTPCALHDCAKAMEWSMLNEFKDRELLRDCYVACESLRNAMGLVKKHLCQWIALRLDFVEPLASADVEGLRHLRVAL